jgi:hypothetical protein
MNTRITALTLLALACGLAACGGATPEPAAASEDRADKAAEATDTNNDRAESAAEDAENSAEKSDESADEAEKSADESKK